ncbi:MAG: ammonia monooxygenase [Candidatus Thiodiazotropha sp. (ex Monitilora ramsayi)]|nr:ammonia monooxygenase [Candidatus Thiodiazotropha sp. (ex Monitilora ramsayi)]
MERLSSKLAIGLPDEPLVWCPGCEQLHRFNVFSPNVSTGAQWQWNNDTEKPTFSPSMVIKIGSQICHSFLRDGVWEFLPDSTHALAGQKVPLPDLPAWVTD